MVNRQGLSGMSEIVGNKIQNIQRCIARAREELHLAGNDLPYDYTRQEEITSPLQMHLHVCVANYNF